MRDPDLIREEQAGDDWKYEQDLDEAYEARRDMLDEEDAERLDQ